MRRAEFSPGQVILAFVVCLIGGIQVGLYMADWYDDGVAEPLSLWIGIFILVVGAGLTARPFARANGEP